MSVGIPVGSNVVESELSTLSQVNLRDAVQKCFQLVSDVYPEVEIEYTLSTQMLDRKSTRLNSSHVSESRMPSSA